MKYTSAEANKLLKKLKEQLDALMAEENAGSTFVASVGENVEECRPAYDYDMMRARIDETCMKIRKLRHAINVFNSVTVVPGFGITIDEMLVYIPQLTAKKRMLSVMAARLPKERSVFPGASNIIDYKYANYDILKAKSDLDEVTDTLSKAQLALDSVNQTVTFDFEF